MMLNSLRHGCRHSLFPLSLGLACVIGIQGCNLFSGSASIEGTWTCITTNQISGQKNEDRLVFGPGDKLVMDSSMPMYGVYELSGKSIILTILEVPEMAKMGLPISGRNVITGTVSKLNATELVLDTVTAKGTKRSSICSRPNPVPEQQTKSTPQITPPPQAPNPVAEPQSSQSMPALPLKSSDPRPKIVSNGFKDIVAKKETGIFELIGATEGLEELIDTITKDKSSMFFTRLTGPNDNIVSAGTGAVFGEACMAHSCGGDRAALYVRDNGAVAVAYVDDNNKELHYFSNIDQKDGIPEHLRTFIEETMKDRPGLTLHGITTTNGVTKVPTIAVANPPAAQPASPPVAQTGQRSSPAQPSSSGQDQVARYADEIAVVLERASHPACRAIASNIRTFGNSGAPDYVRQRQIDSMLDKAPLICTGQ